MPRQLVDPAQVPRGAAAWQPVESSNVRALCFTPDAPLRRDEVVTGWLKVEFRNDSVYAFKDVPQAIFELVANSPSPGGAFNRIVRDRYDSARMDNEVAA